MSHTHRLADPKVFGPGLWYAIHTEAAAATTPERKKHFIDFIYRETSSLKCQTCRTHATIYLTENPPEHYLEGKDPDGGEYTLFEWTWIFHNAVNRRLTYPQVSWREAKSFFINDSGICVANCGEDAGAGIGSITPVQKPQSGSTMYGTLPPRKKEVRYVPTYSSSARSRMALRTGNRFGS